MSLSEIERFAGALKSDAALRAEAARSHADITDSLSSTAQRKFGLHGPARRSKECLGSAARLNGSLAFAHLY